MWLSEPRGPPRLCPRLRTCIDPPHPPWSSVPRPARRAEASLAGRREPRTRRCARRDGGIVHPHPLIGALGDSHRPALRDPTAAELPHYPRRERLPPLSVAPEIVAGLAVAMVVHEGHTACCAASRGSTSSRWGSSSSRSSPSAPSSSRTRRRPRRSPRRRVCPDVRRRRHREHGPHGPRLRAAFRSGRRRHRAGAPGYAVGEVTPSRRPQRPISRTATGWSRSRGRRSTPRTSSRPRSPTPARR